jgi:hypothetical protein
MSCGRALRAAGCLTRYADCVCAASMTHHTQGSTDWQAEATWALRTHGGA